MARPKKTGIPYFPLDVDFLSDIKTRKILRACGANSISVLISLLSNIYRDYGYYVGWDNDIAFLISDEVGVSEGSVEEIVIKAVQVGFFNKELFDTFKILTSKGIQERYRTATYQRKDNSILKEHDLSREKVAVTKVTPKPNEPQPSFSHEKPTDREVNHAESTQSKVKESKVKKSKDIQSESDFNLLWNLYPKKTGRKGALTAYQRAIKNNVTNKDIQVGIVRYRAYLKLNNIEEQFIKSGSTFFNGECWNDEYDMTPPKRGFSNGRTETIPEEWAEVKEEKPMSPEDERLFKERIAKLQSSQE